MPRRRLRLLVAYDGTDFHGFAPNRGVPTVGGALADGLARVLGHDVSLTCAGRTDAGVHAWGQVVTLDTPADVEPGEVVRRLGKLCGPAIVVRDADWVSEAFDARRSATAREYRYTIVNRAVPDPLVRRMAWHVAGSLDVDAMSEAAAALVGEHDFSSFCRRPKEPRGASLVRIVRRARVHPLGDGMLRFTIEASSFCQQMVRSVVGTLVDVGRGRLAPDALPGIIAARDRAAAGSLAPAAGLCLWRVRYGSPRSGVAPSRG